MSKLASCCVLLIGVLHPLWSLPATDPGDAPPLLPALDGEAGPALEEQGGAPALRLPEMLGAARGAGLREADSMREYKHYSNLKSERCQLGCLLHDDSACLGADGMQSTFWKPSGCFQQMVFNGEEFTCYRDPSTAIFTARGNTRKAFSGKDSNILLSKLLARARKQHKQQGPRSECFWKYCV